MRDSTWDTMIASASPLGLFIGLPISLTELSFNLSRRSTQRALLGASTERLFDGSGRRTQKAGQESIIVLVHDV